MYGDFVHYGSKSESLEAFIKSESEVLVEFDYLHFLEAATALAHLYLGFAILVSRAFKLRSQM